MYKYLFPVEWTLHRRGFVQCTEGARQELKVLRVLHEFYMLSVCTYRGGREGRKLCAVRTCTLSEHVINSTQIGYGHFHHFNNESEVEYRNIRRYSTYLCIGIDSHCYH